MTIGKLKIILFTLLISSSIFGQNRTHKVLPKETKYGISKQYGVSIEDLEKLNPDIKLGLKEGSILVIPNTKAVNKSKDTDPVYVKHTVRKGETVYSLSKKFQVTVEAIKNANDGLKDGLKLGSVINLPIPKNQFGTPSPEASGNSFYYHRVQAGETSYSLSKKYKISLDSLYLLNPQTKAGLQIRSLIKLPKNRKPGTPKEKPSEKLSSDDSDTARLNAIVGDSTSGKYFLYKVQVGDSFFSLRKKFKVTKDELIALNPELSNGIELDKYIIIPGADKDHKQVENTTWLDKLFNKIDTTKNSSPPLIHNPDINPPNEEATAGADIGRNYKIALMLPFSIPAPDSLVIEEPVEVNDPYQQDTYDPNRDPTKYDKPRLSRNSITSIEFYNGFLLAVDTLAKQGMPLDIKVFDTRRDKNLVGHFVDSLKKDTPDLVFGPLFKSNVEFAADELKDSGVFVISPLSRKVSAEWRPNLIQCVPGEEAMAGKTAEIINDDFKFANIIFAHTGTAKESRVILKIKSRMLAREDGAYMGDVTFTEDMLKRNELDQVISPNKKDLFVIVSEDKVFLSDLVNKLRQLRDTSISIIAPHKVMDINTLETDYLNMLKLTMADPNYVDYTDSATIQFVSDYRIRFGTEPSAYSFQGYDIAHLFLSKLWQGGGDLKESLNSQEPAIGLQMGVQLSQEEYSGYENQFLYITGIRDMMFIRLDQKPIEVTSSNEEDIEEDEEAE